MLGFDALSKRSRVARRLVLNAAAKINLALEVLGKRDDGYHEVATVMQAVDLSDRLVIEDAEGLELRVSAPDLPSDGRNLVVRAAHALREATAVSRGARITLDKRIPVAAGLGGGSADAAAALVGLSRLWGLRWPAARLAELAVTLGTDVPFFLRGGAALGTGRGERIEPVAGTALAVFGVARWFDDGREIRARVARGSWACWAVRAIRGPAIRMTGDPGGDANDGAWPSGKARDFGPRIGGFESSRPNHTSSEAPMAYELKLLTGNANRPLAEEIGQYLRVPLADAEVTRFSDGEVYVQINENVRGADVFVIQPTCPPVNDTLMELLIMIDALKRASARRITAVLPYYGYARQDRKVQPRVPISAKLVPDLLETAGVARVPPLDLHAGAIQGVLPGPVGHPFAAPVIIDYLGKKELREPVIVAPDAGGVERARAIAKRLSASLAIIDKRREGPNSAVAMHLIGDVRGRDAVVIDDMIDTGGTLIQAVSALAP